MILRTLLTNLLTFQFGRDILTGYRSDQEHNDLYDFIRPVRSRFFANAKSINGYHDPDCGGGEPKLSAS